MAEEGARRSGEVQRQAPGLEEAPGPEKEAISRPGKGASG